jgi:hypothetical protein
LAGRETREVGGLAIFIAYPWLAAAVGVLFVGIGRWTNRAAVVGVGVAWLVYAAYETGMQQRWLCTGECNIRVDLLLIYPILVVASTIAALSILRAWRA